MNTFLFLSSTITGCVFISASTLVDIPIGTTSSVIWFKICAITAAINKYKSTIYKKEAW